MMAAKREGLVALREKAGLSQYDVADKLGMPRSTYASMELGHRPLRIELAAELARMFGVSMDTLWAALGGSKTNPEPEHETATA